MSKGFFKTKYRIMFAYENEKRAGYVVFQKGFMGIWMPARMTEISKEGDRITLHERDAYFKTEEEAKEFIERINTIL